ncbi:MAG: hypothetical protein ABW123_02840 [Cystobacter sp.]
MASSTPPSFRRLSDGSVTRDEAAALAVTLRIDPMAKVVTGMLDDLNGDESDFLVHDGPLHVDGNLAVSSLGAAVLFVLGDLTVTGAYSDTDDPQTITQVTGNLRAHDVVTAGFLEVHGDVLVQNAFFGDYNDCNAYVGGSLTCRLFYPEEHFMTVKGDLRAEVAFGLVKHRVDGGGIRPEALDLDDPRLLEHFDRELLNVEEADGELIIDGFSKYQEVRKRVLTGKPLKTP